MSWNFFCTTTPATAKEDLLNAYAEALDTNRVQGGLDEALLAADIALPLAEKLLEAVVPEGATDTPIQISLGGHANPGNVPNTEWANDFITISVYNQTPKT